MWQATDVNGEFFSILQFSFSGKKKVSPAFFYGVSLRRADNAPLSSELPADDLQIWQKPEFREAEKVSIRKRGVVKITAYN